MIMKNLAYVCVLILVLCSTLVFAEESQSQSQPGSPVSISACFSPNGYCMANVVSLIDAAKTSIYVQMYFFTDRDVSKALIRAKTRSVSVQVIVDKAFLRYKFPAVVSLITAGIPVYVDSKHPIAHAKFILVDDITVATGSLNYTDSADTKNWEDNVTVKGATDLVAKFKTNWGLHKAHSVLQPVQ